ncbi:BEL1-like homeodomain protein 3 [Jatropha curcas]|uniref:BEL1-like homeodomain protein 3 n=1 Tax=Jatropha curcas TaxID=180498 RepID=UPI0005FB36DA|nr:BEL1-like homeodomain protein 3 [Jatropha curcas]XP_020532616.1 BEL1-like homeodomain protein 3 [Jatropha curcas]XP_020532617.1 BEL1-like homeodomain protein 3 [Jatropha curcas]XP_020532618.1 BEL1-like homeodomain protein 3 [Jatropha curcas]
MEGRSFRQESHVAQQSRRDKLRLVEQSSRTWLVDNHHVFPNNLEQLSVHLRLNPDLIQVRNVGNDNLHRYSPSTSVFSSEMLKFSTSCCNGVLPVEKNAIFDQELGLVQSNTALLFTNMSNPINSTKASSSNDPHACSSSSHWRSIDSQQSYDWMVNYASGLSVGRESNNQKPIFVGDVLSNNAKENNISRNVGYDQDFHLSSNIPSQDCQKQQQFTSHVHYSSMYPNTLQDVVAAQPSALFFENANSWSSSEQLELIARKSDQEGLSLTLASNPPARANVNHFGEGYESNNQDSRYYLCPISKPEISNRECGKSVNYSSNYVLRNAGPLGPFTGYATILKSSRFLKPAQDLLLDEFCTITGSKLITTSGEVCNLASVDVVNATKAETSPPKVDNNNNNNNQNSVVSSSTFYSSNEVNGDVGVASSSCESDKPEYQQKKAKLLFLQEEVCGRYKQYDQQMQMVASSFESVAGLSAATPYLSLAFNSVSRNFKCLKRAISDQLRHVAKALGEDFLSPNTGASSTRGDTSTSRMRYIDQSFQRHKSGGANVAYFEPQQHVWRPQRGLPERSVTILRAWLFDHFLHPYPTDTDKHMLATQTGLSRNQVSNWFINARVRVWKPMVEEIHMLETKGLAETNQTFMNDVDGKSTDGSTSQPDREQPSNNVAASCTVNKQLKCSGGVNAEQWNQKKRARVELQVPTSMDGAVMNFLPYQRSGIEIGGIGAVSLTLGLRHGVENAQQQHTQLQQHENQLRLRFGGQMIHDFVG